MTYLENIQEMRNELKAHLENGAELSLIEASWGLCSNIYYFEFRSDLKDWWSGELEKVERDDPKYANVMRVHQYDGFYIYDRTFSKTPCGLYSDALYESTQGNMRLEVLNFILQKHGV